MCVCGTASTYDARAQFKGFCGSEYATEINHERANYICKSKACLFLTIYCYENREHCLFDKKTPRQFFETNAQLSMLTQMSHYLGIFNDH